MLWLMLRKDLLGLHFRRWHPFAPDILDFYRVAAKLCIEIDGSAHDGEEPRNAWRTTFRAGEGIAVLRFSVEGVSKRLAMIIAAI